MKGPTFYPLSQRLIVKIVHEEIADIKDSEQVIEVTHMAVDTRHSCLYVRDVLAEITKLKTISEHVIESDEYEHYPEMSCISSYRALIQALFSTGIDEQDPNAYHHAYRSEDCLVYAHAVKIQYQLAEADSPIHTTITYRSALNAHEF